MKILTWIAVLLALVVIGLGAYTRLTDAGLGCPDWPGCYGHLTVPSTDHHLAKAEASFPGVPVEPHKAWNEMIHRYFAGVLGLCIFALFSLACWYRARERGLALALLSLVVFQALLGMWTVTMSLRPAIVMGHLLGGFCTLALLWLMGLRLSGWRVPGGGTAQALPPFCRPGAGGAGGADRPGRLDIQQLRRPGLYPTALL